jgi:GH35 family endo-1,4-beta-xylanase
VRRCGGSPDLAALSVSGERRPCHARRGGFDLHAGIVVPARDRARLERVCRYALRPPVADDRVRLTATGQVLLALRHRWTDGTTHLLFDPLELLERLAALTPRPRINLVLYYGVLAAHAAWRSRLPAPDAPATTLPSSDDADASAHAGKPDATAAGRRGSNMLCAQLMQRSFGVDVLVCPWPRRSLPPDRAQTRGEAAAKPRSYFLSSRLPAAQLASLKDAYRNVFLVGAAFDLRRPDEFDAAELELIASQFNALTPENSMKPGPIHPQEDTWNWTQADALVEFGLARDMRLFGHTLVWHAQTSPWFFEGATRELALARLRTHILTLVGRYRGRLAGWDVVNEAIADGGDTTTATTGHLRNSPWLQTVGPDFLLQAFRFAREADPDVALHYNDYNIESGFKHQSSLVLLRRLIDEGAPITTVGIQGHWSVPGLTPQKYEEIEQAIEHYRR